MTRSRLAGIIGICFIVGSQLLPWSSGYMLIVGLGMLVAGIVFKVLESRAA